MRRVTIVAVAATLTLAACGAEPSADDPVDPTRLPDPTSVADAGGGEEPGATEADGADPEEIMDSFRDEEAWAVVVIGDDRYEFEGLYCVTIGGALGAASVGSDNETVNIDLPPKDWETSGDDWGPPSVQVSSDEPYFRMEANATLADDYSAAFAGSQVDSYTSDGYRASGSGTFADSYDFAASEPEMVAGTFEVNCPRP
jgi:hypothetical protein